MAYWLVAIAALGIALQAQAAEPSPFTADHPSSSPAARSAAKYARDADALAVARGCPVAEDRATRSAIEGLLRQRREEFLRTVAEPYWRGRADGIISTLQFQRALVLAREINARGPRGATADQVACIEATREVTRLLARQGRPAVH